jgi:acyl-CoA thioesterase-1
MSFIIYFFGSGAAFFLGATLVLGSVALASRRRWGILVRLLSLLGLILVAVSAIPLPYTFYAIASAATVAWLVMEHLHAMRPRRQIAAFRLLIALLWLGGVLVELPYHFTPSIEVQGRPPLWIIGDSVTAGTGNPKVETWPRILARTRGVTVHDRSQMGATVGSALQRLEQQPLGDGIILLEIGGNDLLGSTSAADFEDRLERLLALVCRPGRTVLMFELPLPPFCNEFGRAQRRLAAQYGVALIPRRLFAEVLTAGGATLDGIHLTQDGHQAMAEAFWRLVERSYAE